MSLMSTNVGYVVPDDFTVASELGFYPGWRHFRKFGENQDLDAGTEDVWRNGGRRTLPTTAAVMSVVSDSTADDGDPAGTGAWVVRLFYLDENYVEQFEDVTMDGTTPVVSTGTALRCDRAFVLTCGSNQANVGTITITIGGNIQNTIQANEGQTLACLWTVPANHSIIFTDLHITTGRMGAQDCDIFLQVRPWSENGDRSWRTILNTQLYETTYEDDNLRPNLGEKGDIRVSCSTSGNNIVVSAQISGYLIHNEKLTRNDYEIPYNV